MAGLWRRQSVVSRGGLDLETTGCRCRRRSASVDDSLPLETTVCRKQRRPGSGDDGLPLSHKFVFELVVSEEGYFLTVGRIGLGIYSRGDLTGYRRGPFLEMGRHDSSGMPSEAQSWSEG